MTARAQQDLQQEAAAIIEGMQQAVRSGRQRWFDALMEAIRRWPLPEEQAHGRSFRYLIGGEAFDWLLLAERLCEELRDVAPEEEMEALLFDGAPPVEMDEQDLKHSLGAKYRGHLNFVYGVQVENALQLAVQEEVLKGQLSCVWKRNGALDDEVFATIYGCTRRELLARYRKERGEEMSDETTVAEMRDFTYWLFRYRLAYNDPAKVASDTRKGVTALANLEFLRRHRNEQRVADELL